MKYAHSFIFSDLYETKTTVHLTTISATNIPPPTIPPSTELTKRPKCIDWMTREERCFTSVCMNGRWEQDGLDRQTKSCCRKLQLRGSKELSPGR